MPARSGPNERSVLRLRPASPRESGELGALAMASKAHWGYDHEFLTSCRAGLLAAARQVAGIVVAERDGQALGWYRLAGGPPDGELTDLWVRPDLIGTGLGRAMVADAVRSATLRGLRSFRIEADPHAEGFYLAMGAVRVGEVPSGSVPGRTLPLLRFTVPARS